MQVFRFLKYALSVILIFVGIKIAVSHYYKMPVEWALGIIFGLLFFASVASLFPAAGESGKRGRQD